MKNWIYLLLFLFLILENSGCSTALEVFSQFQKPCPGNPVIRVEITRTPASGVKGGTFGCARRGDNDCSSGMHNKWHGGLDITTKIGSPLFAMYNGSVTEVRNTFRPGQYKANSFGNYISIRSTLPSGKIVRLKFNHLNNIIARRNRKVRSGDVIAFNGNTGNAAADDVIPHVHVQAFDESGSEIDPRPFLATRVDVNGNIIQHCN